MFEDDLPAPRKTVLLEKPALDVWSIEDLRHYIAALGEEIARAESKIAAKTAARGTADSFFRK